MRPRRLLRDALLDEPRKLAWLVVWSVVEAGPAFVVGYAVAHAIDGFAGHHAAKGLAWLGALGAVWLLAAVGARQLMLAVAAIVEPFRDRLLARTVATALSRAAAGDPPDAAAVARTNLQVELARDAFAAVISVVRAFVFTLVGVATGLSALTPRMLPLVLPPLAAGLLLFGLSLPALSRRQREYLLADEATARAAAEIAGGLRDIVACGAEDTMGSRLGSRVAAQATRARKVAGVTAVRTTALGLGGWLPVAAILAGTPWLLRSGVDAGAVVGALAYVTQSLTPALTGLVDGLGSSGVRLFTALDRVLSLEPARRDPRPRVTVTEPDVELRDLTFRYAPYAEPVISSLRLTVRSGEHLAVVGPSGIGKSTLAALITGMLRPSEGRVLVGGVPAERLATAARVLIPQEAYVFRGTVLDNLAYLAAGPLSIDRVTAAAETVGAGPLLRRLGGVTADLDPASLSAGERQLIALTRAFLSPARLTVLDEATCHLDPAAEARAEQAFAARGGTLIVVAHRLSSARRAGRVLLMDGPRVRLGSHAELTRTAPLYADLVGTWDHQPELSR